MKITNIQLNNFKRFTALTISNIPASARLVLVVGPNGSGKSSLFDAFYQWYRGNSGWGYSGEKAYFVKDAGKSLNWSEDVKITTSDGSRP